MAILALGVGVAAVAGGTAAAFGASAALIATAASIGFTIGSTLGTLLFPPSAPDVIGPRLTDLQIQSASYGTAIPLVYGLVRLPGIVLWGLPLEEREHTEEVGGKGGGGSQEVTSYSYWGRLAVGFCVGPIGHFGRVWADGKLIYDGTGQHSPTAPGSLDPAALALNPSLGLLLAGAHANVGPVTEKYPGEMRLYLGGEGQGPDPLIEADKGVGQVPAFRGLAYIVFGVGQGFPLADFGNRYPQFSAEVCREPPPAD